MIHGMNDHARSWDSVARALCSDWHVVAVDLRGHGDSAWSAEGAYHAPYYFHDFADLVDHLSVDDEPITIVAHSLGGNPATRFAALYPQRVKQLVLVDAMGPNATVLAGWEAQGVVERGRAWMLRRRANANKAPRRFATVEEGVARMAKMHSHLDSEQVRHLATHGLRQHEDGYGWKYDPQVGNYLPEDFAFDLSHYWREITAPTLLCWGDQSWTTNPATDGRSAHFQQPQHATFEGAGHWLHHDQLEKFITVLAQFLDPGDRDG
jgi:pimeloyl-ACP methyl ester carboxylesterase